MHRRIRSSLLISTIVKGLILHLLRGKPCRIFLTSFIIIATIRALRTRISGEHTISLKRKFPIRMQSRLPMMATSLLLQPERFLACRQMAAVPKMEILLSRLAPMSPLWRVINSMVGTLKLMVVAPHMLQGQRSLVPRSRATSPYMRNGFNNFQLRLMRTVQVLLGCLQLLQLITTRQHLFLLLLLPGLTSPLRDGIPQPMARVLPTLLVRALLT